jgi:hypothetical protein
LGYADVPKALAGEFGEETFTIGKIGCERSEVWIWLFSSTQKTTAFCGGLR